MTVIVRVETDTHRQQVRELLQEYIGWLHGEMQNAYGFDFDPHKMLETAMRDGGDFTPPSGRMLLVVGDGGEPVGVGCLRRSDGETGEIKRMYIRPAFRGQGIGRMLLTRVCEEARSVGYSTLRLDSAPFMREAHKLYRTAGFREISSYVDSATAARVGADWLFMELSL